MGYRINSTSFWPGDLELEDIQRIVGDLERECDVDFVDLSAGVHHSYIHTPMTYEDGWEREYTRAVKTVSTKPVLLVGPDHPARRSPRSCSSPAMPTRSCSRGRCSPTPSGRQRRARASEDDIRRCVAANYCWRAVIRGGRVQCIYNPEVGRERAVGRGDARPGRRTRKRVLVVGAGPAGLEYARIAAARGHEVVVLEREDEVGGHVRSFSKLPGRAPFYGHRAHGSTSRRAGTARRSALGDRGERGRRRAASTTWSSPPGARYSARRLPGPDGRAAARLRDRAAASRGTTVALGEGVARRATCS